jgi:hypothetical protein
MRLRELDAHFVGVWHDDRAMGGGAGWRMLPSIEGAQGLMFQCPKCAEGKEAGEELDDVTGEMRGFRRGAHPILCWFRNPRNAPAAPDDVAPVPGRWWMEGTSIDDVSFVQGNPPITNSVLLQGGCNWHGYVTNGGTTTVT